MQCSRPDIQKERSIHQLTSMVLLALLHAYQSDQMLCAYNEVLLGKLCTYSDRCFTWYNSLLLSRLDFKESDM